MKSLKPQNLSTKTFLAFGDVIELSEKPNDVTKNQRWANASVPNFENGKPMIDILYSALRPLEVTQLEMHNNSSQTFIPLNAQPFIIIVGIDPKHLNAFISNDHQGITLKAGIWHCSPLPTKKSVFFALLHRSPEVDLNNQTINLPTTINLKLNGVY